jgi:anti-sigma B factor antagonist
MNRPEQVLFAVHTVPLEDGAVRVEAEGELDLATAPQLEELLRRQLDASGDVTLDLSRVTFMDSSGLQAIIAILRGANTNGTRLRIAGSMMPQIQRLIEITGLQDILPVDDGRPG